MKILILGASDVRHLLDIDDLLEELDSAFRALSSGHVEVPPRMAANVGSAGFLACMSAYTGTLGLGAKMVSVFHGNHAHSLPSHQALITLFDPTNGSPLAIMEGTRITAIRTATAAALSARHLARKDSKVLAIVGAGVQGHAHLEALPHVRDFREIRITSRDGDHARELAKLHPAATAVSSTEEAIRGADVVALCTASGTAVIRADWVSPGTHITSVGFSPPEGELDRAVVSAGRLFVELRAASFQPPPVGCWDLQGLPPSQAAELGEVLMGTTAGRTSDAEITVYKSMGHAVEDLAAARLVYQGALRAGAGKHVEI